MRQLELSPIVVHLSVPVHQRSARGGDCSAAIPQLDDLIVVHVSPRFRQKSFALLHPPGTLLQGCDHHMRVELPTIRVHEAGDGARSLDPVNAILMPLSVEDYAPISGRRTELLRHVVFVVKGGQVVLCRHGGLFGRWVK